MMCKWLRNEKEWYERDRRWDWDSSRLANGVRHGNNNAIMDFCKRDHFPKPCSLTSAAFSIDKMPGTEQRAYSAVSFRTTPSKFLCSLI